MQFPRDASRVARDFLGAGLWKEAVGFDVTLEADVADGIRVGIGVLDVRALGGFGVGEDKFRADFDARADGLGKRISRLDEHVLCLLIVGGIEDERHRGQPRNAAHPRGFERRREFERDHARVLAKDGAAHLKRKLHASGHDREVGEAPALEARALKNWRCVPGGHSVAPLLPTPVSKPVRVSGFRERAQWRGSSA